MTILYYQLSLGNCFLGRCHTDVFSAACDMFVDVGNILKMKMTKCEQFATVVVQCRWAINVSPCSEWQTVNSQSACADETHYSFNHQFKSSESFPFYKRFTLTEECSQVRGRKNHFKHIGAATLLSAVSRQRVLSPVCTLIVCRLLPQWWCVLKVKLSRLPGTGLVTVTCRQLRTYSLYQ